MRWIFSGQNDRKYVRGGHETRQEQAKNKKGEEKSFSSLFIHCYEITFLKSMAPCLHSGQMKSAGSSSPSYT